MYRDLRHPAGFGICDTLSLLNNEGLERWPSGWRRTLGKRVYVHSVTWVRIPLSPRLIFIHPEGWQSLAECTGLENQQGFIPFGGSNPSPSANLLIAGDTFGLLRGLVNKFKDNWNLLVDPFYFSLMEFTCGMFMYWVYPTSLLDNCTSRMLMPH